MDAPAIALRSLKLFLDVVRCGSFAAAAREQGVDPSSVSRHIAALEQELGFRLFERTTRRLAPTEAGQLYFDRAVGLVEALEEARAEAADVVAGPKGRLRVTTSVAFAERWLLPRLPAFREAYPELELDLLSSDGLVDLFAEGIDVAVRLSARVEGPLVVAKLMDTRYRVVVSPAYLDRALPLTHPADLAGRDCLCFTLPGYRSRWRFRRGEAPVVEVAVRASLAMSNALVLRRAALDGHGPALLADWTVEEDIASGRLVDLLPDWEASAESFDTAAWLLYPSRAYVPVKTRVFIDHLRQQVRTRSPRRTTSEA